MQEKTPQRLVTSNRLTPFGVVSAPHVSTVPKAIPASVKPPEMSAMIRARAGEQWKAQSR